VAIKSAYRLATYPARGSESSLSKSTSVKLLSGSSTRIFVMGLSFTSKETKVKKKKANFNRCRDRNNKTEKQDEHP
jgi:hypothetical protein